MTELRPWAGFESLGEGLARLQARARKAAVRLVDEILTLRNWPIGSWIVAYEQELWWRRGRRSAVAPSGLSGGGGGLAPGAHAPGFTRSPLRGWVKRAAIAPKGRQRIAWGVSPRIRSQPRSKAPKGRQQAYLNGIAFKACGIGGLGRSNLRNYRQIALTWPMPGIRQTSGESQLPSKLRQTLSGEVGVAGQFWQTLSAESLPALPAGGEVETIFEAHLGTPGLIDPAAKGNPC